MKFRSFFDTRKEVFKRVLIFAVILAGCGKAPVPKKENKEPASALRSSKDSQPVSKKAGGERASGTVQSEAPAPNKDPQSDKVIQELKQLADENPAKAEEYILKLDKERLWDQVMEDWCKMDPQAASHWASQLPEGDTRNWALSKMAKVWAEKDPQAAWEFASQLPEGNVSNEVLLNVAMGWAKLNVAISWAEKDPQAAAKVALQLPEGDARNLALSGVAWAWAEKDPQAAAEFASQLPEGDARNRALSSVALAWAQKDPQAAAKFALQLPYGNARNLALSGVARAWAEKDPQAAAQWAMNQKDWNTLLKTILQRWSSQKPDKAQKWLDQSGLPEDAKAILQKSLFPSPK